MINPTLASLSSKATLRKRLDLSGGDDYDDDDDGGAGGAKTVFKMHKTAKKRVNPFKAAPAAAQQAKRVSLPRLSSPQPCPPSSNQVPPTITHSGTNPKADATIANADSDADADADDDIDDYLSMTLPSTSGGGREYETSAARRLRKLREAEARARVPSKAELAAQEKQLREEGLSRSLLEDKSSRGYLLMKAMGWKGDGAPLGPPQVAGREGGKIKDGGGNEEQGGEEGEGEGREEGEESEEGEREADEERGEENGHDRGRRGDGGGGPRAGGPILEPIALTIKEDRAGIGHLTEQQRKYRDSLARNGVTTATTATQAQPTTAQPTAESYRERIRLERLEKKAEAQFYAAQAILEAFDTATDNTINTSISISTSTPPPPPPPPPHSLKSAPAATTPTFVPLRSVPLLYRSLIKHREDKLRQARLRHIHASSLPTHHHHHHHHHHHWRFVHGNDDDDDDDADGGAYAYDIDPPPGPDAVAGAVVVGDDDDDGACTDEELDAFNQLPFTHRLDMIVHELREKWTYCFWCKHRYASSDDMDGSCPGVEEDLHG